MLWARECEDASSPPPNPQKWVEVNDFKSSPSDHRQADQSIYIYQESNKQCIYIKNTCLYIQIHHKRAVHASWIPWSINPQLHAICHENTCDQICQYIQSFVCLEYRCHKNYNHLTRAWLICIAVYVLCGTDLICLHEKETELMRCLELLSLAAFN